MKTREALRAPPIFIIGSPRSGTTLLRLMITCHRNIVVPPECGFIVWWREKYSDWRPAAADDAATLTAFVDDLFTSRKFDTWQLARADVLEFLNSRRPATYSALVASIYELYGIARGRSVTRWGDKNNFHVAHVPVLAELFPNAQFVHIVRDGRNVACSYRALARENIEARYAPRLPSDVSAIAEEWRRNVLTARAGFEQIGWNRVHELRFEDLILRADTPLREVCAFLGEEYDPAMLEYHAANREAQLEPQELMAWKTKTLSPPLASEAARHLTELSPDDARLFEAIAGDVLAMYSFST